MVQVFWITTKLQIIALDIYEALNKIWHRAGPSKHYLMAFHFNFTVWLVAFYLRLHDYFGLGQHKSSVIQCLKESQSRWEQKFSTVCFLVSGISGICYFDNLRLLRETFIEDQYFKIVPTHLFSNLLLKKQLLDPTSNMSVIWYDCTQYSHYYYHVDIIYNTQNNY